MNCNIEMQVSEISMLRQAWIQSEQKRNEMSEFLRSIIGFRSAGQEVLSSVV
jgi:hypothetical protein